MTKIGWWVISLPRYGSFAMRGTEAQAETRRIMKAHQEKEDPKSVNKFCVNTDHRLVQMYLAHQPPSIYNKLTGRKS